MVIAPKRPRPNERAQDRPEGAPGGLDAAWERAQQSEAAKSSSEGDELPSITTRKGDALGARSPQPTTVEAARRAAARELAHKLANDDSPYALCPDQPEKLLKATIGAAEARMAAIPHNTRSSDAWGFGWAMRFGCHFNTPWMRPRHVGPAEVAREVHFYVMFLMFMAIEMKPAARTKAKGFTQAKPDSPMNAIYAYRRVLRDCARYLADLHAVLQQLKAERKKYLRTWGDAALVKDQQQPLSKQQQQALLAVLELLKIAGWAKERHDGMRMYMINATNMGIRNDEQCSTPDGTFMKRANFVPVDGAGREIAVSAPALKQWAVNGAMLRVRSVASKCDADNSHWGSRDMWFRYDDSNGLNLPATWAWYETKYPCPPDQRAAWPAVSPQGNQQPYSTAMAAADHKCVCIAALGEEGKAVTPHVHRVTLATGIMALPDTDEPTAQALVRWKTVESLRVYYKMLPSRYADVVDRATRIDAAKESNILLPETEPSLALERLDHAIDELQQGSTTAARKGRKDAAASSETRRESSITQFTVDQDTRGQPIFLDADTADDPHDVLGQTVALPNESWTGWERCATKCKGKPKARACEKCKQAAALTTCNIVAYSSEEALYVIDAQGQHYAFQYQQIAPHFTARVQKRAREAASSKAKPPAQNGRQRT